MKSIISEQVFAVAPSFVRGVVIGRGIDNSGERAKLVELLRKIEQETLENDSLEDLRGHPRVASWRALYTELGVNPNKFVSSIESLCKRVRKGAELPYINTAVALFNYFSLKHIVPSGGDDLAAVEGDLRLIRAKGDEPFVAFNSDVTEYPLEGEVIYTDDTEVMCRRWNWRQGNKTKLEPETANIAVNVDCLPPVSADEAETITRELVDLMKEFCGGEVSYVMLNAVHPEAEV